MDGAESKRVALMIVASVETDRHKARRAVECVGLGLKLGTNFCGFGLPLQYHISCLAMTTDFFVTSFDNLLC
jgi:hypothetical protein